MRNSTKLTAAVVFAFAFFATALCAEEPGEKLAEWSREAEEAVSVTAITAAAESETNVDVLLGLTMLTYGKVGNEIAEKAASIEPNKARLFYMITTLWPGGGPDKSSALIQADPFNALPYYRKAAILFENRQNQEALDAFRQGTTYERVDTYMKDIGPSTFEALDALNLKGPLRLAALLRAARRIEGVARMPENLCYMVAQTASEMTDDDKETLAENLLTLAGQALRDESGCSTAKRTAYQALRYAFRLKSQVASKEKSPQADAYTEAARLMGQSWARLHEGRDDSRGFLQAIDFAFDSVRTVRDLTVVLDTDKNLNENAREQLQQARLNVAQAAENLIEMAAKDPDSTVGLWLSGCPEDAAAAIENGYPELVTAAEELMKIDSQARKLALSHSPVQRTKNRLKQLGLGMLMYSNDHEGDFPDSFDTLVEKGYIHRQHQDVLESAVSGERFIYVEGMRDDNRPTTVLAYDKTALEGDLHLVLFIDGHVASHSTEDLNKLLKKEKQ